MLPIASRRCRVRNPVNGAVAALDVDRYAVLTACDGCRTLAEHATVVRQKLNAPADNAATILEWLNDFAAQGLLTPLDDLLRHLGGAPSPPAPFAGIVIRTCDRPGLLARALGSAAALAARYGRHDRYIILDDSQAIAHRAANRQAVATHPELGCTYLDLAAPTALERELIQRFPDAGGTIAWLLGAPAAGEMTYGRPVNLALLLTAGQRLLMLDDDATLDPRRPPIGGPGFAVSSDNDELFCYPDRDALDAACPPLELDPIAAHLDSLGQSIGSLWARFSAASKVPMPISLDAGDVGRFNGGARALFTQNHAVGDPGSSLFPYHLLSLPRASRAKLLSDPAWPGYAFAKRFNWRGQPRLRLATKRPLTLTTLTGFDNGVMLPPTVRAHRNEDLLLGEMAQHVHPDGWLVDLPWGLSHWRHPAKAWLDPSAPFAQEPVHFLLDYLQQRSSTIESDTAADRMQALAALLLDLSAAGDRHLTDLLAEQVADTATRTLFSIATQLDDPALPAAWKDMLRPWLESPALSIDSASLRARSASTSSVRVLVANYGRALAAWPALWNAARDLQTLTRRE